MDLAPACVQRILCRLGLRLGRDRLGLDPGRLAGFYGAIQLSPIHIYIYIYIPLYMYQFGNMAVDQNPTLSRDPPPTLCYKPLSRPAVSIFRRGFLAAMIKHITSR